ncbi:3244_t:CDS:2 [Funneliformis geosporum]|uniref:15401_t:CDS:1 n=1 Tax=Funneliformis geosporum TaxID=1117311 RepID=A0A9W4WNF6_9GLOM|nr:15401_t:CDS:2 [Funneliformis geosporum]CAI2171288.1 3244_t:CDS:2 [Funneliformis geosporum]
MDVPSVTTTTEVNNLSPNLIKLELDSSQQPTLVSDILEEIFSLIAETDSCSTTYHYYDHATLKDLYSCTLVNRQWCASAVRILWKSPFSSFHNGGHKLITTYLRGLDIEERRDLKLKGIKLPTVSPIPMFNYPSLIRHLDYGEMLYAVEVWCSKLPRRRPHAVISVMRVLLRLFLHNAGPLSSLKLASLGEDYHNERVMILAEPEIKSLITSVKLLSLDGFDYNQHGLLVRLPDLCKNIEYLHLRGWYGHHPQNEGTITSLQKDAAAISLRRLIKAQKSLISLDMIDCKAYLGHIISALDTQSISLRQMKFRLVDFKDCGPWDGLATCHRLKKLEFWFCKGITQKMINPLIHGTFPELEEVKMLQYGKSCEEFRIWINNMNGTINKEEILEDSMDDIAESQDDS